MTVDNIAIWINQLNICRLGAFQDSKFFGDLEDSKSTSGGIFMYLRKSNICSDKLDVQEANNSVSQFYRIGECFTGCLRMDGVLAFDLWDVVIEVLHPPNVNTPPTQNNFANEGRAKGAACNCLRMSKRQVGKER